MSSSKAVVSAHLMSHLSHFQFLWSFHVCHLLPTMIAMPQLVLASKNVCRSTAWRWCGMEVGGLESSACNHQCSSLMVPHGCLRGMNGLLLKMPNMDCSAVR